MLIQSIRSITFLNPCVRSRFFPHQGRKSKLHGDRNPSWHLSGQPSFFRRYLSRPTLSQPPTSCCHDNLLYIITILIGITMVTTQCVAMKVCSWGKERCLGGASSGRDLWSWMISVSAAYKGAPLGLGLFFGSSFKSSGSCTSHNATQYSLSLYPFCLVSARDCSLFGNLNAFKNAYCPCPSQHRYDIIRGIFF